MKKTKENVLDRRTNRKPGQYTGIEWCQRVWNPFVGCSVLSSGCANCYAMRQAKKMIDYGTAPQYIGTVKIVNSSPVWTGVVNRAGDRKMREPLRWGRPSLIFVNSMTDFFHENAKDEWRLEALDVIQQCQKLGHRFQILTKRPEAVAPFLDRSGISRFPDNVWLGVTVEREDYRFRVDILRTLPAKVRFISAEPLVGEVGRLNLRGIHWVIAGGESGVGARPMNVNWVRAIRDDCVNQGVAIFFKQFGHWRNNPIAATSPPDISAVRHVKALDPVGKGGSLLDGKPWKQFPVDVKVVDQFVVAGNQTLSFAERGLI